MTQSTVPKLPNQRPWKPAKLIPTLTSFVFLIGILYGGYFWMVRRVVVGSGQVLVLVKKNGSHTLSGDQVVIPRPPTDDVNSAEYKAWQKEYGDCNGIIEQVYAEGTYFGFSPWDYERSVVPAAAVASGKTGVVIRKFGGPLDPGQVVADPARAQRGPLPGILSPGRYNEYSNPYAYDVLQVDPIYVDPGHRAVVTIMAGDKTTTSNQYLSTPGAQGVQPTAEPEGFLYVNPFVRRVTPISVQSQRLEMTGEEAIHFPSSDSFEIRLEGFVEWRILPEKLPLLYVQYGSGSELIPVIDERVILPYARSFCRLVGSKFTARDFIAGDTKLKFQQEFEERMRSACLQQGIEIKQALVRDIVPPDAIKNPINEREVAKQQIRSLEQQILVAKSKAELAEQTEMAIQNTKIGDANTKVVTIVKKSEQESQVAITLAKQKLAVAKLQLEAAAKQAAAQVAIGEAEAAVMLLQKRAEAEPLQRQVQAFGGGDAYARFFFAQKMAPSIKTILANTDGPFADLFKPFFGPQTPAATPAFTTPASMTPASVTPANARDSRAEVTK